ncbi:uncharacterized protein LOC143289931 isoform X2 [Babylonia areolata]|uniref:uncharacterized protein LOC143289931 isoform X2 n=1 Tax=Babylonia areolata TaxID=304850 RepID=UPI003FD69AED
MSESESTSASTIVRQTRLEYEEMRRKLAETEKKLNRLARLEARGQSGSSHNAGTGPPEPQGMASSRLRTQRDAGDHSTLPDLQLSAPTASVEDVRSVRSELSTLPGSYTGFASRPFPASTPSKQALAQGTDKPVGEDVYDSDSSGSLHAAGSNNNNSVKLLRQNQRLLSEVERLVCELQSAKHREGELRLELEGCQGQVTELQERVEELRSETEAQDKALRSAEQHLMESQRQTKLAQQELLSCQQHIKDMRSELEEERKARSSVEAQRDEAVRNFLDTQTALEDFQRRNHERMKKLEESEDHLRDSLAHTNAERDELLHRVDSLQTSANKHEAEIERLQALMVMEQETKEEMETQSLDLRRQLAKLTTRLQKAEEEGVQVSRLRQENAALLSEVEEGRELISQLEDIADHLRRQRLAQQAGMADDSGNFSIHLGVSMHSNAASSKTVDASCSRAEGRRRGAGAGAEGNTNNNGSTISNLLTELRGMLFEMDDEIRRLRSQLSAQEEEQRVLSDMRAELNALMSKAEQGEQQTRGLEQVVGRLEADKAALARQVMQQEQDLTSQSSQLCTVEARLAQRNAQIIELQEDANRRCEEISCLEKEIWKKSSAISQLESKLEEKRDEVNDLQSQVREARQDATLMEGELKATRCKAQSLQMDVDRCRANEQQNQAAISAQCRQFDRQLEKLRSEMNSKESLSQEMQRVVQQAQQELAQKDTLIHQLETTLLEAQKKLSDVSRQSKECVAEVEARLSHSVQQNSQLESALLLCRNEIAEHLTSMERTRQKFDSELGKRENTIQRLEDRVRSLQQEMDQHAEHNVQLEREVAEKHSTVLHLQSRLAQLEGAESALKDNVGQLEQQLMREKGQWMMEADELERKLSSLSAELDTAQTRSSDLKTTIKELQEEARQNEYQRCCLEEALQKEKAASRSQAERIPRLERDIRDLRVELEQKIEIVNDLEDMLRNKDADLDQQRSLVEQLDVDKLRLQRELKQLDETKSQLEASVERLQFDGRAKEQILSDTREVLRKTEAELSGKTVEASDLRDMLDERQKELEERVKAVKHLEHTITETQEEMSQRMQRVDSTLHKYETEIAERTAQIADLDDRLKETQAELMEKSRQLGQQQQLSQRQQMELQAATAKVDELDNTNARQKQRLEEQRKEIVDITQDMRLTREQHQTEHMEFLSVRRDLAASRREVERLCRELEEREAAQCSKDQDTARLSEELGSSQARAAQSEARLVAREKQHERDLAELRDKYQGEVDCLRRSREEVVEQQVQTVGKLKDQMSENELVYRERLDSARCELEALQNELSLRRDLVRNANDTICKKDHEIANLKAQVSRLERQGQTTRTGSAVARYQASLANQSLEGDSTRTMVQLTSSSTTSADHQYTTSNYRFYSNSSPLSRHDLSHNNANLPPNPHPQSHSVNELPMKDTWDDKDPQDADYTTDRLIFSFEKLGAGPADTGGERVCVKDGEGNGVAEGSKSDTTAKPPAESSSGPKEKGEGSHGRKGGGGGGTKSAGSVSFKAQAAHSRALSAPSVKVQGLKLARRKAKAGGAKVPVKKLSSGKGERGDFSHQYKDPETLVSTYKGGASPTMPE